MYYILNVINIWINELINIKILYTYFYNNVAG